MDRLVMSVTHCAALNIASSRRGRQFCAWFALNGDEMMTKAPP